MKSKNKSTVGTGPQSGGPKGMGAHASSQGGPGMLIGNGSGPRGLAVGAAEVLVALQTPFGSRTGVPLLTWGKPGQGKTSFLESLARPGFPVHQLLASIHDPTDFGGLPVLAGKSVQFMPPQWAVDLAEAGQGILLLDDITTAAPAVQAALLRVVLDRKVGNLQLPADVRIVAAANPPEELLGGWDLSEPLANRFVHLNWDLPAAAFAQSLVSGFAAAELPVIDRDMHAMFVTKWSGIVAAFLSRQPSSVNTKPADGEKAFATPRTWRDFAINLMASCDLLGQAPQLGDAVCPPLFVNLLVGCVGSGAAAAFLGFVKSMQLPDPGEVLDGRAVVNVNNMRDDELHVFFSTLANRLLERVNASDANALEATFVTLDLVNAVAKSERIDVVFPSVRFMAKKQIFQQCITLAEEQSKVDEFQKRIRDVFVNEGMEFLSKHTPAHLDED